MNSIDPHEAINYMIKNAKAYAQAKAEVTYLEQYRKSKKAILFASAMGNTIADKESYAYSHPEYLELLEGLKAAVSYSLFQGHHPPRAKLRTLQLLGNCLVSL